MATDHLQQMLKLRYPNHSNVFSNKNVENIKKEVSMFSLQYNEDLERIRIEGEKASTN